MQVEVGTLDLEGQGASMLSLRSQTKPIPEVLSYVASEGKVGKRQPDSKENTDEAELNLQNTHQRKEFP